jgi:hypothetical protein
VAVQRRVALGDHVEEGLARPGAGHLAVLESPRFRQFYGCWY